MLQRSETVRFCKSVAGYQNGVHQLDPATHRWTDLSPTISGDVPLARQNMGLAELGGSLYLFGGRSSAGNAQAHANEISEKQQDKYGEETVG